MTEQRLVIDRELQDDEWQALVDGQALRGVHELVLRDTVMTKASADLLTTPACNDLRTLIVERCCACLYWYKNLGDSKTLINLNTLIFHGFEDLHDWFLLECNDTWGGWRFGPWWHQLRRLEVHGNALRNHEVDVFFWFDGMAEMESVSLQSPMLTDHVLDRFAREKIANLRALHLHSPNFTMTGWRQLAANDTLTPEARATVEAHIERGPPGVERRLQELHESLQAPRRDGWVEATLHRCEAFYQFDPDAYESMVLPYLRTRTFWARPLGIPFSRTADLTRAARLMPFLTFSLELGVDESINWEALAQTPALKKVTRIEGFETFFSRSNAVTLLGSEHLGDLREITWYGEIASDALLQLYRSLPDQSRLELFHHTNLASDWAALVETDAWNNLGSLQLKQCTLTAEMLTILANAAISGFFELTLSGCGIDPDKLAILLQAEWLEDVDELNLRDNPLGEEGLRQLLAAPVLQEISEIHLDRDQVAALGHELEAFQEKLGLEIHEPE
ncbi:MAG: hypothetical protein AAFV53_34285 [Myxococcota bacterium]